MASTRVPSLTRAVLATVAVSAALAGCGGDDKETTKASTPPRATVVEPSSPPNEGSARAKAITVSSSCGKWKALSVKDRDAAAFYVTKQADTNQAGFPQWRKLIDQWCKRDGVKNSTELSEFIEPFKKSNTPQAPDASAQKNDKPESGK